MVRSPHVPKMLRVFLLGHFAVYRGDRLILPRTWKRRKAATLFKLFLLAPNHAILRDQAIELLFPDADPAASIKAFNTVLHSLRRTICPPHAPHELYITTETDRVYLNPECLAFTDADVFEAQGRAALHEPQPTRAELEAALALYTGDLLPDDLYADWATARRESLRDLFLSLLLRLAETSETAREDAAAVSALQRILKVEPAHEDAHRRLIRLYARMGQRHAALRQYQRCLDLLRRELEIAPMPETTALYRAIVAGEIAPLPQPALATLPSTSPFIGRARELEWLMSRWRRAREGAGQTFAVVGEMGVGKTRLMWEFLSRATEEGAQVAVGAAREQEGALPYAPIVEALEALLRSRALESRRHLVGVWASDLVKLFPDLFPDATPSSALDPALERERLFRAMGETMAALARERPLILFVDDVHAADETTVQLLAYLAHRAPALPVALGIAARAEELAPRREHFIGEQLRVENLSAAESAQLVHALEKPAPHEWAATIYTVAEGNPLFTQELVRTKKEGRGDLPPQLRDALTRRLRRLPRATRAVLEFASVLGREFDYATLCAVGDWSERTVVDALDAALETQLVEEGARAYQFRHGVMRLALYEELSETRRAWWHRRAGETLEPRATPEILAHHFALGQVADQAVRYLLQAAQRARRVYAMDEAAQHLRIAEEFVERLTDTAEIRFEIYSGLGDTHFFAARYAEAEKYYTHARELGVDALGNCRAAEMETRRAMTFERRGDFEHAVEGLRRGQALLEREAEPCIQAARLYHALGQVHINHGEHRAGLEHARHAVAILDALPSSPDVQVERAIALRQLGMGHGEIGEHADALRAFGDCLTVAEQLGDEHLIADTLNCLGSLCVRRGEYDAAIGRLQRGLDLARHVGDLHTQALCLVNLGDAYQSRGEPRNALQYLQESARLAEETGARSLAHFVYGLLVQTTLALNELDAAREYAERAFAAAEAMANPRDLGAAGALLGRVAAARGEWDAAEKYFADSLAQLSETQHPFDSAQAQRWLGEMLARQRQTEGARVAFEKALALYHAVGAEPEVRATEEWLAKL